MRGEVFASTRRKPIAGVRGQPLADHPAERHAAPCHAIEPEPIQQGERVAAEPFDRVVAGRRVAAAMAAQVVAQDAETAR